MVVPPWCFAELRSTAVSTLLPITAGRDRYEACIVNGKVSAAELQSNTYGKLRLSEPQDIRLRHYMIYE